MNRIDPDTFRGKIWLLIVDKIIIGLILGVAFLIYDNIKTKEVRAYNEVKEEIQLSIRQAEMKKQFLPIVLDSSKNVRERVHSLTSLVQTNSIDPYGAISLAGDILEDSKLNSSGYLEWESHPDLRYLKYELYKIAPKTLPQLLEKYLIEYAYHLKDFHSSQQEGDASMSLAKNAETGLWINLLGYALDQNPNAFEKLNDKHFLIEHLETFDAILPAISEENSIIWAQSKMLGLRIIGTLELLATRNDKTNDIKFITNQLRRNQEITDYQLGEILFKLIQKGHILSDEITKVAFQIIKNQEKSIEHQNVYFKKYDPKRDLFYKASEYLIWSCKFAQIDSKMESIILPEIEEFIMSLPQSANPNIEHVNSSYMRQLIESRIKSNSAQGLEPSPASKEMLIKLFNIDERILDAFNLVDLKEKWEE